MHEMHRDVANSPCGHRVKQQPNMYHNGLVIMPIRLVNMHYLITRINIQVRFVTKVTDLHSSIGTSVQIYDISLRTKCLR